jgi:hypothetical protein
MEPLIREGAEVGVVPLPAEALAVGDLAAFTAGGLTFVHRVIALRHEGGRLLLREKGDANATSTWIGAEQVLGRAAWVARGDRLRRLDAPSSRRGAAALAAASRLEADLAERVRALLPQGRAARRAAASRALLLPLKAAALPLLAVTYPESRLEEGPELDFLLACARHSVAPEAPGVDAPPATLDWTLVLQGAGAHGVAAAVLNAGAPFLPPGIADAMKRSVLRAGIAHLEGLATLREAGAALRQAGIPFLVLKGPALASRLYGSGAERPATDLDLLVSGADRDRALAALAAAGYREERPRAAGGFLARVHFHAVLLPAARGRLAIELHWDLVDRANLYRIDAGGVLARRVDVVVDGVTAAVPAPEDELLYLALHAAKHGIFNRAGLRAGRAAGWFCRPLLGNRLLWFIDIHRLLARCGDRLDWGRLRERAAAWNVLEEVRETLSVLRLLFPGTPAGDALHRIGAGPLPGVPRRRAGAPARDSAVGAWTLARLMRMDARAHFRPARVPGLLRTLFPSPARLAGYWRPLSRVPLPLLYLRHPFHVAAKIARDPARGGSAGR